MIVTQPVGTSQVRSVLRELNLYPKKSMGQNFLTDEAPLEHILEAAKLAETDLVLEIGPGLGILTTRLAQHAQRVVAIEVDRRLAHLLSDWFEYVPNVQIVQGDILKVEPHTLLALGEPAAGYKVVANLPYNITSAVLRHMLEAPKSPTEAVFMVQKEVAERICARPGDMSILAVSVQFYADPQIMYYVPATAFYPQPKVESAVLHLDVLAQPRFPDVEPRSFFHVVRAGFSQKRKQLINSLSAGLQISKATARSGLEAADIDPRRRPETLALDEWRVLYLALQTLKLLPKFS